MIAKEYPKQEFLNECFTYIEDSGDLIWKKRPIHHFNGNDVVMRQWNTKNSGKVAGTLLHNKKTGKKYLQTGIKGKLYLNHRLAYIIKEGDIDKIVQIDHEDTNGLNNKWSNIRLVSGYEENNKNRRRQSNNTSGVTGVWWFKPQNKWVACIGLNGKKHHLGYFDTIQEAADARAEFEMKFKFHEHHGKDRDSELDKM